MQDTDTVKVYVVLNSGMVDRYDVTKWDILTTPTDNLLQLEVRYGIIFIPVREIQIFRIEGRSNNDVKEHISFQYGNGSSVFKRFTGWIKS